MESKSYQQQVREKIKHLGRSLGFEVAEEWTPSTLIGASRQEIYVPRIDVVWFKQSNHRFVGFLHRFGSQGVLDPYRDIEKEIVVGFELELGGRATKYILGDVSNLSRLCDYGFIVMQNTENLVKRSIKASRAFGVLHGTSNVFTIDPDNLDAIIDEIVAV
jgi:hypothetical protein